jgi:hypothetical protein
LRSVGDTTHALRESAWGKALLLVLVLVAALLVSRSCGKTDPKISQDQAVAIAEREVDFEPNDVRVRYQKRGLRQGEYWLVGLGLRREDGTYERATNVLVDGNTGDVAAVADVEVPGA